MNDSPTANPRCAHGVSVIDRCHECEATPQGFVPEARSSKQALADQLESDMRAQGSKVIEFHHSRVRTIIDALRAADEPTAQHPFAVVRQSAATPDDWSVHWPNSSVGNFSHSEARMWAAHMNEAYEAGRSAQPPADSRGIGLAELDWNRLRSGDRRALDPEHQPVFDLIETAARTVTDLHGAVEQLDCAKECTTVEAMRTHVIDALISLGKLVPPETKAARREQNRERYADLGVLPTERPDETSERRCCCDMPVPSLDEDYCAACAGKL